ncbi:MAG: hypothetical protein FH758_12565 [Firmicutes bacterium]|nr:hypothetical protein [Bacillota bacterium]
MKKLDIPCVDKRHVITSVLESIANFELSLASIINTEADEIKIIANKLISSKLGDINYNDILEFQKSVNNIFKLLIKMQMLIQFKTDHIISTIDIAKDDSKDTTLIYGNPEDCF